MPSQAVEMSEHQSAEYSADATPGLLSKIDPSTVSYRITYWFLLLLTVTGMFQAYLAIWNMSNSDMGVPRLTDSTVPKQFVSRLLFPLLANTLSFVFPAIHDYIGPGLMYLFLLGFVFAFRYLLSSFWKPSVAFDTLTYCSVVALLPMLIWAHRLYDFATLFLFTLALGLLARRKWKYFLIVFTLAGLNRETAFLLSLVFAFHFWGRLEKGFLRRMCILQAAIYLLIRGSIGWIFRDNPGPLLEYHLRDQLLILAALPSALAERSPLILAIVFYIAGPIVILLMILFRWREKPLLLRHAAVAMLPLLWVSYLLFGFPFEIRFFFEAYSVILPLTVAPLFSLARLPLDPVAMSDT